MGAWGLRGGFGGFVDPGAVSVAVDAGGGEIEDVAKVSGGGERIGVGGDDGVGFVGWGGYHDMGCGLDCRRGVVEGHQASPWRAGRDGGVETRCAGGGCYRRASIAIAENQQHETQSGDFFEKKSCKKLLKPELGDRTEFCRCGKGNESRLDLQRSGIPFAKADSATPKTPPLSSKVPKVFWFFFSKKNILLICVSLADTRPTPPHASSH